MVLLIARHRISNCPYTEDITYASVGLIVGRSISGVFSDSKWQETYVNFSLFHHDPAFHAATHVSGVPIMWSMVPKNTKKAASVMRLRNEMVNVTSGMTIGFKRNDGYMLLTMGAKLSNLELLIKINEDILPKLNLSEVRSFL